MHKTVAVSKIRKMEQLVGDAKSGPRFTMLLFSLFGVFACILAAVSVYGLAQRRREMGIRMALGAQRKSVLLLMMRGEMRAALLGGIFSLPLMLGFVVLCSLGLAPRIVGAGGYGGAAYQIVDQIRTRSRRRDR